MITTEQYNQHLKSWKGTIYKTRFKLSRINQLDYAYQQDLLQVGKTAVYEALIASQTNGKTGNDANGLIAIYIDSRMKDFAINTGVVRKPKKHYYDREHSEKMGSNTINYIPSSCIQDEIEYDPDNDDNQPIDDEEYFKQKAIQLAMKAITEDEREIINNNYGDNLLTQTQMANKIGWTTGQVQAFLQKRFKKIVNEKYIKLKTQHRKHNERLQSTFKTME